MSSRIFQSVIIQLKDATDRTIGVVDNQGFVVACSELSLIGSYLDEIRGISGDIPDQIFTTPERTFRLLGSMDSQFEYAVFVSGHDALARSISIFASVAMTEAKSGYEEKHDKATFIKNIISDNILPGDVYVRAKELHFSAEVLRAVFLIRQIEKTDMAVIEVLQNMFPDRQKDFVLSITETDLVLIKEMPATFGSEELYAIAENSGTCGSWPTDTRKPRSRSRSEKCSTTARASSTMKTLDLAASSISCRPRCVKCS